MDFLVAREFTNRMQIIVWWLEEQLTLSCLVSIEQDSLLPVVKAFPVAASQQNCAQCFVHFKFNRKGKC